MIIIISIVILVFSIIVHEVAHGYTAELFGDPTPRLQGRLTLNPIKHVDPIGSILVPLITSLSGFTFGWAKPVEYNPYNIKNKRLGELSIALAGPVSNLILAIIFSVFTRIIISYDLVFAKGYIEVFSYIIIINLVLAVFNLIPLPPLDGSKLLFVLFPQQYGRARIVLEGFSPIFILVVVIFIWQIIYPVVPALFKLLTGV